MSQSFDADSQALPNRLVAGIARIGLVLKSRAWQEAGARGLTPTQGQILSVLRTHPSGVRLSDIAEQLGVSLPTASDAMSSLVEKGLALKERSPDDGRALQVKLTDLGKQEAERAAAWSSFLLAAVDELQADEQQGFLRSLLKIIHSLERQGFVVPQRMCPNCRYFETNKDPQSVRPHFCALMGLTLAQSDLRLDCPDQQPGIPEQREQSWKVFLNGSHPEP
jgi:DNA-binding MarR family transcriptional regulator